MTMSRPTPPPPTGGRARRPRGLSLASPNYPGRETPKILGLSNTEPPFELIGLEVPDARYHLDVLGLTGVGKTEWQVGYALGEAIAGRGFAFLDMQGDGADALIERLPRWCADRTVIIDPRESIAPPAYNPLAAPYTGQARQDQHDDQRDGQGVREGAQWAAEHVAASLKAMFGRWWGDRMDYYMRVACLTLARRPGSTLPDVVSLLTDAGFRRYVLSTSDIPDGLRGVWRGYDAMTSRERDTLCAPLVARLHSILFRRFAADLLGAPRSTFDLSEILDGGILIVRAAKGEVGTDTARLVCGLLVAGLWAHTTRRAHIPREQRLDASVILDEAHNVIGLPIDVDLAFAESRGYRVSWVVAHQHDAQLPPLVRFAIDANARNKIYFKLAPEDAARKARHFEPYFTPTDLPHRPAYQMSVRSVHHGQDTPPYTLSALPLPPPIPGRAELVRERARARAGLPHTIRQAEQQRARIRQHAHGSALLNPHKPDYPTS